MQARQIIRAIVADSGMPMTHISQAMNRSYLFIGRYVSRQVPPGTELLAEICDATGHDLLVRNRTTGREIIIDPPRKENDEA